MPTVVKGVADARRILRKVDPQLYKDMNQRIIVAMKDVRDAARSEVTPTIPGLTNFIGDTVQKSKENGERRGFPKYNPSLVRKGLTYSLAKKKASSSGFSALYSMLNKNAAGAIIETAGRLNPGGVSPTGGHFIDAITNEFGALEQSGSGRKGQGRLMGAALASRKSKVQHEIAKAIDDTIKTLQREVDAA